MRVKLLLLLCAVGSSIQQAHGLATQQECHPTPSEGVTHYIVGYGSLINSESKNKTYTNTGINIPVRVNGFRRTWTARGYSNSSLSTTYLGVEVKADDFLNGVIFSVPDSIAIQKYDQRERYYCRVKVPWENISIVKGEVSDNGTFPTESELKNAEFWIYVTIPKYSEYPDERYPIVQSYVDIFLGGCLQMERKYGLKNYSAECITQTTGWNYPWVNDRLHPRRPFAYQSEAGGIDRLIGKFLPEYQSRTYIERIYYLNSRSDACVDFPNITPFIASLGSISTFLMGNRI